LKNHFAGVAELADAQDLKKDSGLLRITALTCIHPHFGQIL
jgi:hypothetical protein